MTTVFSDFATCPVCGESFQFSAMGSTSTFGSMDLDTRPPEMKRSSMCYWLVECPECGYVFAGMRSPALVDRSFVDSDRYRECDGYSFENNLSKPFYRHYLIMKEAGEQESACIALLHTVWTCDDGNDSNAKTLRELLVHEMETLLDSGDNETLEIMKADVLRRSAQFDKLINEYEGKQYDNELLNNIVKFQLYRAKEHDTGCYTVQHAIDYCTGAQA